MTLSVKHKFNSAKSDGTDATLIKASNWNDTHSIAISGPALIGSSVSGTSDAVEITLGTGLSFTGNVLNATGGGGGSGTTNLTSTSTSTTITILSDTGADVTLSSANSTVAGILASADKVKLDSIDLSIKANIASPTFTGNVTGISASMVGLGNANNTSDLNKPVSIAQANAIANAISSIPLATQNTAGLMSASDKYAVAQMPSVTFLQNVQHTRTLIVAHAGDSISYLTGQPGGTNLITQALARIYTGRIEYGDHNEYVYNGDFSLSAAADVVTLTYDPANAQRAFFESKLQVGKWILFPTSGISADFNGIYGRITSFNTTAHTVTLQSNSITRTYVNNGNTLTGGSFTNLNIIMSETTDRYNLAQGGWTSTEILTQIPYIQGWQVMPDILILNGGTNDGTYANSATNIQTVANAALAAGVKCVLLMPMTPKVTGVFTYNSSQLNQFLGAIHQQESYARNTPGVYLFDPSRVFLDPVATGYAPIGGTSGANNAVTSDGLHPSVRGGEVSAQFFAPLLQIMSAQRYPRALSQMEVYDAANNTKANLLGRAGTFYSSGVLGNAGTINGTNNAGLADGWSMVTQGTGPVITPSIVTSDYMPGGYKAQRFALSGTTDSGGGLFQMSLEWDDWSSAAFASSGRIDGEVCIKINAPNITKCAFLCILNNSTGGGGGSVNMGPSWWSVDCDTIQQSSNWMFITLPRPFKTNPTSTGVTVYLQFAAKPSIALSGTIEIAHCGAFFM